LIPRRIIVAADGGLSRPFAVIPADFGACIIRRAHSFYQSALTHVIQAKKGAAQMGGVVREETYAEP